MELVPLAFIIIPLLLFCWHSLRERRNAESLTSFFLFGDKLPASRFMATLVSSNTAVGGVLFVIAVYGYWYGFGSIPWIIGFWIATQLASTWVLTHTEKRSLESGGRGFIENYGTLHEFLGASYNSRNVRMAAAAISIIAYMILVAAEIVIATGLFTAVLPEPPGGLLTRQTLGFALAIGVVLLVGLYSAIAGYRAVIKTDFFQLLLILIMFAVLAYVLTSFDLQTYTGSYTNVYPPLDSIDAYFNGDGRGITRFVLLFGLANILFWGGWWPGAMDQWQRCAATRSTKVSFHWLLGTVGLVPIAYFSVLTVIFVALGVVARLAAPDTVDPTPLFSYLNHLVADTGVSYLIIGLVAAGLASALISTLDTFYVVMAQSLISDISIAHREDATLVEIDEQEYIRSGYLRRARSAVLIFCITGILLSAVFTFVFIDLFSFIYIGFGVMFAVIPVVFLRVIRRKPVGHPKAAFWSIVVSGSYSILFGGWLIFMIERDYRLCAGANVGQYYDILYFLSPLTAIFGLLVYIIIKATSKAESGVPTGNGEHGEV